MVSQHALPVVSQHALQWGVGGSVYYPSMHCRWYSSMPCSRGVISQHALQQEEGSAPRGSALGVPGLGGLCSWGVCCQGGSAAEGGVWWRPPPMATAVGSTHPTGMHSFCLYLYSHHIRLYTRHYLLLIACYESHWNASSSNNISVHVKGIF